MTGKVNLSEPTLPQYFLQFILSKATAGIKILSFGGIKDSLVLNIRKVIFEILCSV